jgi:quinol monooxygenase YgiN
VFCVVVWFEVKPGFEAQFRKSVLGNAAESLAKEPGCRTFDVCEGAEDGNVFLYELYDNESAFQQHLGMPHFKRFDAETAGWVADKRVATYTRLNGADSDENAAGTGRL